MEALYILLGWLLGILSPGITKRISDYYKKVALERIIISELKDVKIRLAGIPMRVHPAYGTLDRGILKWVQEQTHDFVDFMSEDYDVERFTAVNLEDDNIVAGIIRDWNRDGIRDNPAFHFKKMEISIIDSNLINAEILDNNFLTKLLEIKFQIKTYNEEVQSVHEYLKMTFDSNMTDDNHRIVRQEIRNKNYFISEKAIYIVKKINHII